MPGREDSLQTQHVVAMMIGGSPLRRMMIEGAAVYFLEEPYEEVPAVVAERAIKQAGARDCGDAMFGAPGQTWKVMHRR